MIIDKPTTSELERDRLESRFQPLMSEDLDLGRLVSYVGNKKVPFLRLYRYKEAFSTKLVDHSWIISQHPRMTRYLTPSPDLAQLFSLR